MKTARLQLPATSANLGPGFDALALALELFLEIEAVPAAEFSIRAIGRDHEVCGALDNNLLIESYRSVLVTERRAIAPLAIRMRNDIPLGMGCGSSAAVRLAAVALAVHFGSLAWSPDRIVETAARLEGHPDNVAACWYGGLTIAAGAGVPGKRGLPGRSGEGTPAALSISPPPDWRAILVLPGAPVPTAKSRAVLPESYSAPDVVKSIQNVAMLTAAFALRQADLLPLATQDVLHQPYRAELCPLLPALLPLAGKAGVLSVTLSGAGPAVLVLYAGDFPRLKREILEQIQERIQAVEEVELMDVGLWGEGASVGFTSS